MNGILSVFLLSVVAILLSVATPSLSSPAVRGGSEGGRPSRPDVFSSPDELRTYLDQLSDYFAVAGRPRFGKRLAPSSNFRSTNVNKPVLSDLNNFKVNNNQKTGGPFSETSNHRYSSSPSDLYDLLYQYDE